MSALLEQSPAAQDRHTALVHKRHDLAVLELQQQVRHMFAQYLASQWQVWQPRKAVLPCCCIEPSPYKILQQQV